MGIRALANRLSPSCVDAEHSTMPRYERLPDGWFLGSAFESDNIINQSACTPWCGGGGDRTIGTALRGVWHQDVVSCDGDAWGPAASSELIWTDLSGQNWRRNLIAFVKKLQGDVIV